MLLRLFYQNWEHFVIKTTELVNWNKIGYPINYILNWHNQANFQFKQTAFDVFNISNFEIKSFSIIPMKTLIKDNLGIKSQNYIEKERKNETMRKAKNYKP